jgi:hypothetical protein
VVCGDVAMAIGFSPKLFSQGIDAMSLGREILVVFAFPQHQKNRTEGWGMCGRREEVK